jgi:phenylalanyl-tRNA synthetase beta chain
MKISLGWLKTLIDTGKGAEEIASILTATGLEVEHIEKYESVKGGLAGLVIGEVLACSKHPGADRLSLTKVSVGEGEPLSIVCGAPNVAAGQKVVVATVGTTLYPLSGEPFTIKRSKIRGEVSEGMICAEDEIGLGEGHAGIMVLPADAVTGKPASEYFETGSDVIFEIGLTPNRGDAASHYGVARELAAALNSQGNSHDFAAKLPDTGSLPAVEEAEKVTLKVHDRKGCPRYSYAVLSGVEVTESPDWLKQRLRAVGVRPINNIVDVTNFVMLELGQPLHAFDRAKLSEGKVNVRRAFKGETLVTLDGVERKLNEDDLLIADGEKPLCIAGVLGGSESGVGGSTSVVFLESAYFEPESVRASAKRHGIRSEASFRFERGTDPDMTVTALRRAAGLIMQVAGGTLSGEIHDDYPVKLEPFRVAFSYTNCIDLVGKDIDRHHIRHILTNLGMEAESEGTDGLLLLVPRFRADVTREADVIEEVLRMHGYNHVEADRHIRYTASQLPYNHEPEFVRKVSTLLEHRGFSEMMGLSLTRESLYNERRDVVRVLNPLSADLAVLRPDLLRSGLEAVAYNINRKSADLRFFEFGSIYGKTGEGYTEERTLSLVTTGSIYPANSYKLEQPADFYFMKSIVSELLAKCGLSEYAAEEAATPDLSYGLSYAVNGRKVVGFGLVQPSLLRDFDIAQPVCHASFDWKYLYEQSRAARIVFRETPRFPFVRRDLALLVDRSVSYKQLEELAFATERRLLTAVNLFDIYEDKKLGDRRSYAMSFTLQDETATLTDRQIDAVMEKLVAAYRSKLGAELRN